MSLNRGPSAAQPTPRHHPDDQRLAELLLGAFFRPVFGKGITHLIPGFVRMRGCREGEAGKGAPRKGT